MKKGELNYSCNLDKQ